jgi:hypothetical protein
LFLLTNKNLNSSDDTTRCRQLAPTLGSLEGLRVSYTPLSQRAK